MSDKQAPTLDHVATVEQTSVGYQPVCTCGWKGRETDRMSDDYAWTNADDQRAAHQRSARKPVRGYLGSTPWGDIDDSP